MDDLRSAGTGEPDIALVAATVLLAAVLVFAYECHQRAEDCWHGPRNYRSVDAPGYDSLDSICGTSLMSFLFRRTTIQS